MVVKAAELLIDSRNRNKTYPSDSTTTVNNYKWDIGGVLKNVQSIEVLYAEIPNSYYNVYAAVSSFTWTVGTTTKTVTIPVGNYSAATIPAALNTAIAASGSYGAIADVSQYLEFSLDATTDQLKLTAIQTLGSTTVSLATADTPYWMAWTTSTVAGPVTLNNSWLGGATLRLGTEPCIYFAIEEIGRNGERFNFGTNASRALNIDHAHVLTRFQTPDGINFMNYFSNERNMHERHFDEPFNLSTLTVQWLRPNGDLIDFNGADHSMHLRVIYDD